MRLLIVDDEYYARQGIMTGVNWDALSFDEVLEAGSYAEAVEIMERQFKTGAPVDVCMCDIEMPDESGLELIAWINEHYPDTQCLILSCHDEFDLARQAVSLHCLDYVLKPVHYDKLTEILAGAIEEVKRHAHRQTMEGYGKLYVDSISSPRGDETGDVGDIVRKVADYIDAHLADKLSVRDLANMAYVSPDHLTRTFKKRFGKTVSDYITGKRMALAGELLHNKTLTITMVSDRVGYDNYSYFTEQFKKFYGCTPREYQNAQSLGQDSG